MAQAKAVAERLSPHTLAVGGGVALGYLLYLGTLLTRHRLATDLSGHPTAIDFISFWSAGHLALQGRAFAAYDWPTMHTLQTVMMGHDPGGYFGWAYPPLFLGIAVVLAAMPYMLSFLVWVAVTFALYGVSLASVARDRGAVLLAAAAPAALACAMVGQNGFLSAALIAWALLQVERRPWLAGLLLGLLTYKPHLGLLFPVALIAGGYWRAFSAAAVAALAVLLLSWLAAPASFSAFAAHLGGMSANFLGSGSAGFYKMQSLYGALRMLGVEDRSAFAAQAALLLVLAAFIAWLWRSERSLALKCAGLAAGTLLATPYLYFYDFPVLSVAIAFLWRDRSFSRLEVIALVASQLLMAAFMVVRAPMGFAAAILVLAVIAVRAAGLEFKAAPRARPA